MKLREKRIVSLLVAMIVMFTNCLSTYGVQVDHYQYGSIFVVGQLAESVVEESEEISSAALKLGLIESPYVFS